MAVFRRELKVTDDLQGSNIRDAALNPLMGDVFDGEMRVIPASENSVTLDAQEIPLGNTISNSFYVFESQNKLAPTFGDAELVGLDLNIYHTNMNYKEDNSLADIEIYKFDKPIPELGVFPRLAVDGADIIVGSTRPSNATAMTESFDGETGWGGITLINKSTKSTSGRISDEDLYMTLEDAFWIQMHETKGNSNQYGSGLDTKSAFKSQYCHWDSSIGAWILPLKTRTGRKHTLSPKNGLRWTKDFAVKRYYYDWQYAVDKGFTSSFKDQKINHTTDATATFATVQEFKEAPVMTTEHTSLSHVRHTPNVEGLAAAEAGGETKVIHAESTPTFSTEGDPPSGQCCLMRNRWTDAADVESFSFGNRTIPYQSQMIQMRIPYPLHIARQFSTDQPLDSLCVSIKFNIMSLSKYHRSNHNEAHATQTTTDSSHKNLGKYAHEVKEGHNLWRSIIFMAATRAPAEDEDLQSYIAKMNGTTAEEAWPDNDNPNYNLANWTPNDGTNRKNYYNGVGFIRWANDPSNDVDDGDIKIINSGKSLTGNDSQYWDGAHNAWRNKQPNDSRDNPLHLKKASLANGGSFVLSTTIDESDATVTLGSPSTGIRLGMRAEECTTSASAGTGSDESMIGGQTGLRTTPVQSLSSGGSWSNTNIYLDQTKIQLSTGNEFDEHADGSFYYVRFVEGPHAGKTTKIIGSTAEVGPDPATQTRAKLQINSSDNVGTVEADDLFVIQSGLQPFNSVPGNLNFYQSQNTYVESITTGIEGYNTTVFELSNKLEGSGLHGSATKKFRFNEGGVYPDAMESLPNGGINTKEWYTMKIFFSDRDQQHQGTAATEAGYLRYVLLDSNDKVVWTRRQAHQGQALTKEVRGGDSESNRGFSFPSYLTIWANNIGAGGSTSSGYHPELQSGAHMTFQGKNFALWKETTDLTTEVTVAIDSIKMEGFEPDTNNATLVTSSSRKDIEISSESELPLVDTVTGFSVGTGDDVGVGWFPQTGSLAQWNTAYTAEAGTTFPEAIGQGMPTFLDDDDIVPGVCPTYISYGFTDDLRYHMERTQVSDREDLHFFMGDFTVSDFNKNDHTNDEKRMKILDNRDDSLSVNNDQSDVVVFASDNNTSGEAGTMGQWFCKARDSNLNAGPHLNDRCIFKHDRDQSISVDRFSKKGFWTLRTHGVKISSALSSGNWTKRENPAFSTKITKVVDANMGIIEVANPDVLMTGNPDEEYIIYRAGQDHEDTDSRETAVKFDLQKDTLPTSRISLKKGTFNTIRLNRWLDRHLHDVYISPYRYWIVLEIYNQSENDRTPLPHRSYDYSIVCGGPERNQITHFNQTKGVTFNETIYSDTAQNSNKWKVTKGSVGGLIHDATDFGFGTKSQGDSNNFTSDDETGSGYINKYTPVAGYNKVSLDKYIEQETSRLKKPDELINLVVTASEETKGVSAVRGVRWAEYASGESWSGTTIVEKGLYEPYLTFYYNDEVPEINSFKVEPDKDNPYLPKFTWEANDDDLWYGFIIIDNKEIKHQYENAVAVIHLNETYDNAYKNRYTTGRDMTGEYVFKFGLKRYDGSTSKIISPQNTSRTVYTTTEGLSGDAFLCHGNYSESLKNPSWIEYNAVQDKEDGIPDFTSDTAIGLDKVGGYYQPRDNFSILLHFTCDDISVNRYLVSKYQEYDIYVGTDGLLHAKLWPASGTAVELQSSTYINTDGQTPTCVIVTFEEGIANGNVKLFLNGKVEDQTGKKTEEGSANNWKNGQKLKRTYSGAYENMAAAPLTIGAEGSARADSAIVEKRSYSHSGTIEEVVLYDTVLYPVVPVVGEKIGLKPFKELTSNSDIATGQTVGARLFLKDYHNIRGTTILDVASSSMISIQKGGLGLYTN